MTDSKFYKFLTTSQSGFKFGVLGMLVFLLGFHAEKIPLISNKVDGLLIVVGLAIVFIGFVGHAICFYNNTFKSKT